MIGLKYKYLSIEKVENILTTYDPHACLVVYSIDDKTSFSTACDILHYLSSQQSGHKMAKLLVSNKVDLERSRVVSLQGGKDDLSWEIILQKHL